MCVTWSWLSFTRLGPLPPRPTTDPEFSVPRKSLRSASRSVQVEEYKAAGGQCLDRDTREQFRFSEEKEQTF